MPVFQTQTAETALMKHRRSIEDGLMKSSINLTNEVAILFEKPEGVRDGRPMSQPARVAIHTNYVQTSPFLESDAVQTARCGPCQLIKISDFIGFDPDSRPGASARVEQSLNFSVLLISFLQRPTLLGIFGACLAVS